MGEQREMAMYVEVVAIGRRSTERMRIREYGALALLALGGVPILALRDYGKGFPYRQIESRLVEKSFAVEKFSCRRDDEVIPTTGVPG